MIAVMFLLWQYLVNNSCMSALLTIFSIRSSKTICESACRTCYQSLVAWAIPPGNVWGRVWKGTPLCCEKFLVHTVTVQDGCHRLGKHVIGQQAVDPVGLSTVGRPYDHHGRSSLEWNDRLHSLHIHAQWSMC